MALRVSIGPTETTTMARQRKPPKFKARARPPKDPTKGKREVRLLGAWPPDPWADPDYWRRDAARKAERST